MRPAAHRARPVRVTNEGKEMADEEQEKFDKEYMNLGPQFQIPNPELGPLEKRVQTTFVEGLLSGDIKPEDSDYWFTEPEGRLPILLALPSLLQLPHCHACLHYRQRSIETKHCVLARRLESARQDT